MFYVLSIELQNICMYDKMLLTRSKSFLPTPYLQLINVLLFSNYIPYNHYKEDAAYILMGFFSFNTHSSV